MEAKLFPKSRNVGRWKLSAAVVYLELFQYKDANELSDHPV